jgi:ribosomal protein S18 acetylase RimI-like enzyme
MIQPLIKTITAQSPELLSIQGMLKDLFGYVEEQGILMPLIENGEKLWIKSIENTIDGRFGILFGAFDDDSIVGFTHCMIRFGPPYLGGHKVGYISQLYVTPDYRKKSIGKLLMESAEQWFSSKNVHSFELLVHATNIKSIEFYKKLGYINEFVQMRKFPNRNR